jgi:hypothetical protein
MLLRIEFLGAMLLQGGENVTNIALVSQKRALLVSLILGAN